MYSIVATQPGDISVLQKKEFEISEILPNQVLIKNHSIGVNFIDIYFRKGLYPWPQENNLVLGSEGAGIIEAVGSDVVNLRVGDRVAYAQANNAYATHRILDANLVVRIPDAITFDQAAAAMLKGLTVRYLLKDSFEVKSHHTVLFHAAAGGVGQIFGQWAKTLGCNVIGTVGTDEKIDKAKGYGYDYVINYNKDDFAKKVMEITNGKGVPVVYDGVGKNTLNGSLECLSVRGMMVSFGNASGPLAEINVPKQIQPKGLYLTRPSMQQYLSTREEIDEGSKLLFEKVGSGKIKIEIFKKYKLSEAVQAHKDLQSRKILGPAIIVP